MIKLFAILDDGDMLEVTFYGYPDGLVDLRNIVGYYGTQPEQLVKDLTKDQRQPMSADWLIEGLTNDNATLQLPFRLVRKFFIEVWPDAGA